MSLTLAGAILLLAGAAAAGSVDLQDRRPRWVGVTFEVSPREAPGRVDAQYSASFDAWLQPGETPELVEIVVPSRVVEEHLLHDESPLPGSFSDFVWVFDSRSGEVVSATFTGSVVRTLNWGLAKTKTSVRIQVDMSTRFRAGFAPPRTILGQVFFGHCTGRGSASCTVVDGVPLDPGSGYVNAVGAMRVNSSVMTLSSFSPLGEAIFQEVGEPSLQVIAGAESPQLHDLRADSTARAARVSSALEIN